MMDMKKMKKVYKSIKIYQKNFIIKLIYVDDISDTGDTFNFLLKERGHELDRGIYTATIHVKPHTKFKPNFYQKEVDNDEWIVYPWEE